MNHQAEMLLQEFAAYTRNQDDQENILSLYLVVDPADERNRGEPKWPIFLKNALADIEKELDPQQTKQYKNVRLSDQSDKTKWARTRLRLDNFIDGYMPEGKTLVMFVGPNRLLSYELPVALTNLAYYGQPHIAEFLYALDEYQEYLVVLFAQDRARAINMFLGQTADDVSIHIDQTWHRKLHKTAHDATLSDRLDEIDRRFARQMAAELDKHYLDSDDVERIIFGGNLQVAHAVRNYLHPSVADKVVAMMPVPIDTSAPEIAGQIRPVTVAAEREFEERLVQDLLGRAKAGGRAVLGQELVNEALDRQAVSELVLIYPADMDEADDLLVKALHSSADTEFVEGAPAAALQEAGGIGAFLYYTF
ncbi:MAG: hypothetical protein ACK2UK_07775 [Candidatus Promineifilaceae bacterium]